MTLSVMIFWLGQGLHLGSVLSLVLRIVLLEAFSREMRSGCPKELLYANNLAWFSGLAEGLKW